MQKRSYCIWAEEKWTVKELRTRRVLPTLIQGWDFRSFWRSYVHHWKTQPLVVKKLSPRHTVLICRCIFGKVSWKSKAMPWHLGKELQGGWVPVAWECDWSWSVRADGLLCCIKIWGRWDPEEGQCLPATTALQCFSSALYWQNPSLCQLVEEKCW